MQYITLRKWRTTSPDEIKEFPFIVTYRGVPTYKVLSISEEYAVLQELPPKNFIKNSEKKPIIITADDIKKVEVVLDPELDNLPKPDSLAQTIICEAPNQRCKEWATKKVNFESPDHEDMTLYFCDAHYKKLKGTVEIYAEENI